MSFVEHAVIAAAGLGSRLGRGHPKCLLEVQGISILQRQLRLLEHVPDVRVVVGFEEKQVIAAARAVRTDVIFVRNPAFRSTSTLQSYAMGASGLAKDCLFMDADILFEPQSFSAFLGTCQPNEPLIGVTAAKTTDAVFAHLDGSTLTRFSRTDRAPNEWANLCWLPARFCEGGTGAVFELLADALPLQYRMIESFEIDTPEDHAHALANADFL